MRFGVLGPVGVSSDKGERLPVGGPKQRTVLALLIAAAGRTVSTDELIDGVYGDDPPAGARRSIQTYVSNLRGDLGGVIEPDRSGYLLRPKGQEIDAVQFADAVEAAATDDDPEHVGDVLRRALALWRGHPYGDVDDYGALMPEIIRLDELRLRAIEMRIDADLRSGRHRHLIAEIEALTVEHPLRERFRGQHMLALYRSGRQAEALRAYDRTRRTLVDELGLDPSPELRNLEQRILDQDPELAFEPTPAVTAGAVLVADVADATALESLATEARHRIIAEQSAAFDDAAARNRGRVFAQRGSAMYAWFADASSAAQAAASTQVALAATTPGLRMAIAAGDVEVAPDGSVSGPPISRAAAIAAVAHAGQVLLSLEANRDITESGTPGLVVRSLGEHDVTGLSQRQPVHQLVIEGLPATFPPLLIGHLPPLLPIGGGAVAGYELREEIGSGTFGLVHRAYQPSVGREVAIKIIRPEFANDVEFIRRFEVEAQLVARLEHPHIVPLHDYWREPDGAFLVMRWLKGGSLEDRLAAGRLSLEETSAVLATIGPALAYAHRHGVAHRDLKAANVLFDSDGVAYLSDFGIARSVVPGEDSPATDVRDLRRLIDRALGRDAGLGDGQADVASLLVAWELIAHGDVGAEELRFTPLRNPYKGLQAFGESDAADFCGRETAVMQIVEALGSRRLVAVVGPSGVGKSSVVRAGLLPALRAGAIAGSERWLIVDMLPGGYPFDELASALLRVATGRSSDLEDDLRRDARGLVRAATRHLPEGVPLLLVVDQFEELFTLTASDEERTAFLDLLRCTVTEERSDIRVVMTIRADHFDRPLRFGGFGDLLRQSTVPVAAPTEDELRAMVQIPAEGVGVQIASGLVDRLVGDVKDQPGALPLLEFTLTEMFDQRRTDRLTVEDYHASHGVLGALGRRSEEIFEALSAADQAAARQIFVRLANVAETGRVTRRRMRRSILERLDFGAGSISTVLAAFGEHRLLTFDRDPTTRGPTVEVAHEAILQEWPRLAGWIEELREDLLLHGRLAAAVTDWETTDRSEAFLLTGGRLSQHEAWTGDTELKLSDTEREFLTQSRRADDEQRHRRRRRRRSILAGFGAAAVAASLLAVFAFAQRAESARRELLAQALALTQSATAQIDNDPERAALIAIEAYDIYGEAGSDGREAIDALREALMEHRIVARYEGLPFMVVDPTGTTFVTDTDGGVVVRRIDTGDIVRSLVPDPPMVARGFTFSPDGSELAVAFEIPGIGDEAGGDELEAENLGGVIIVFDLGTGERHQLVELDASPFDIAWSGEYLGGMRVVPGSKPGLDRSVFEVWDESGRSIWQHGSDEDMAFAMDAATDVLAIGHEDGFIEVRSLQSGDIVDTYESPLVPLWLSLSPTADRIAMVDAEASAVAVIDIETGDVEFRSSTDRPFDVAWSDDGAWVVAVGNSAVPEVFDAATGESRLRLRGQQGLVDTVATVAGTDRILTGADSNGDMVLWDIGPGTAASLHALSPGPGDLTVSYDSSGGGFVVFAVPPMELGSATLFSSEGDAVDRIERVKEPFRTFPSGVVGGGRYLRWMDGDEVSRLAKLASLENPVYTAPIGWWVDDALPDLSAILLFDVAKLENPRLVDAQDRIIRTFPLPSACHGGISGDATLVVLWDCNTVSSYFYDVASGAELQLMRYVGSWTRFMPQGDSVLTVDGTGQLRLSDLDALRAGASYDEAELWSVDAHDGFVTSLTINSDGSLAASAARGDGVVRVWDLANLATEPIAEIPNPLVVHSPRAEIHPTLPHLLIVTDDGVVHEITFDADELLEIARTRLTRTLTELECERYLRRADCTEYAEAS